MNVRELIAELGELDPGLPVWIVTGDPYESGEILSVGESLHPDGRTMMGQSKPMPPRIVEVRL